MTWQWAPAISIMHSALPGIPQSSKPVLISEQRQRNIEIRNMPPRKRPGPKEPLYTSVRLSWPPLKLQFQFDHTRRVVDARSRIDAIDIRLRITLLLYRLNRARRERARAPGQVNEPGLQYELHHNPYLPNLNSQR